MRRVIVLVVVALVGAALAGTYIGTKAVGVNGTSISQKTLRGELASIEKSESFTCYLTALYPEDWVSGSGGSTMAISGATAWTNLRLEGIAIQQFVQKRFKFHLTSSVLAQARASLVSEMTTAASNAGYTCPTSASAALDQLPPAMVREQLVSQATSLVLVNNLSNATPLTTSSLKAYFAAHQSDYDTICVSIALVAPSEVNAFEAERSDGLSVAQLAKKFSVDASASSGGVYGCYAPSSSSYDGVRSDTTGTALNTFGQPYSTTYEGQTYALFVAPTKRTPSTYDEAASAVLSDVQSSNASDANTVKEEILYADAVSVDPALGRWGENSDGPAVFVPAVPEKTDVQSPNLLTSLTAPKYR